MISINGPLFSDEAYPGSEKFVNLSYYFFSDEADPCLFNLLSKFLMKHQLFSDEAVPGCEHVHLHPSLFVC